MLNRKYVFCTSRKLSFFILPLTILSLIFIIYQLSIYVELSGQPEVIMRSMLIRGTHEQQARFYKPSQNHKFICIHSMEEIEYEKVNDDYCDCMDGSDEPGTDACSNGIFYCISQKRTPKSIHSSKVNDRICDCCDGSDEWKNRKLKNLDGTLEKSASHNHPPCPNIC